MPEIPRPTTEEMIARHDAERNLYLGSCTTQHIAQAAPIDLGNAYDGRALRSTEQQPASNVIPIGVKVIPAQRQAQTPDRQAVGL